MAENDTSNISAPVDFVIIAPHEDEQRALLEKLESYERIPPSKDDVRVYFWSDLPVTFPDNSTTTYRIILMPLLDQGRVQAVVAAADAIRRWKPHYVILVGIGGGVAVRGVQLGDILISNQVVDYELQKLTDQGPRIRWNVHQIDSRLFGFARSLRDRRWQNLVNAQHPRSGASKVHIGSITSGDKEILYSDLLKKYHEVWPDLIGVEREAGGVVTAAFQAVNKPGFFMIRGVSNLADENNDLTLDTEWRAYACDVAAAYTIGLLKNGPVPSELEELRKWRARMRRFANYQELIDEWKELHDLLQDLNNALRPLSSGVGDLYATSQSSHQKKVVPVPRLQAQWSPCQWQIFRLSEFAKDVKQISAEPYYEERRTGPEWIIKIVSLKQTFEEALREEKWDIRHLFDLMNEFSDTCNLWLFVADKNLRKEATALYDLSKGYLQGIEQ